MAKRIVVLVSGAGSNLQALLDREGGVGGDIVRVVSDNPGAGGLSRARRAGVETAVVDPADHADRPGWQLALIDAVAAADPRLVVLAGFMRILSDDFVHRWPAINVHPSLLPAFPGANAVAGALAWGVKVTGVTVHFVDEQVDHGPIIAQEPVGVHEDDTVETLHPRLQEVEHRLLPEAVAAFCQDRLAVEGRLVRFVS